ncbi:MAG: hypothetical protein PHY28_02600 [Dehalococcoidales bacterium]|nr:hypothetical protein [Dehalococcoidales bacterium]
MKTLKGFFKDETGQALLVVMVMFILGGLTITPCLNYVATCLKSGNNIENNIKGIYAAEAGVENVIWCLEHSATPPTQLTDGFNQMNVALQNVGEGDFTLYFGTLVEVEGHSNYLSVAGDIVWDAGAQAYKYTITVTKNASCTIHIISVGARLPPGYTYQAGSANSFPENLSTAEPVTELDGDGAQMVNWEFGGIKVDPVKTQTFYITGEGELEGDYTWVIANRSDVGEVGEIAGTLYTITATATNPADSKVTAKILANVMLIDGSAQVVSWKITK